MAAALAVLTICLPVSVQQYGVVIADALLVPLAVAAAWSFVRLLQYQRLVDGV